MAAYSTTCAQTAIDYSSSCAIYVHTYSVYIELDMGYLVELELATLTLNACVLGPRCCGHDLFTHRQSLNAEYSTHPII